MRISSWAFSNILKPVKALHTHVNTYGDETDFLENLLVGVSFVGDGAVLKNDFASGPITQNAPSKITELRIETMISAIR